MKLIRIKIDDPNGFRGLPKGFELHFSKSTNFVQNSKFEPYVLAGRNGSGKSNVLEAIASIFFHLECCHLEYRPENFEFDEENNINGFQNIISDPDAFEMEYYIPLSQSKLSLLFDPHIINEEKPALAHVLISKKIGEKPIIKWLNRTSFEKNEQTEVSGIEVKEFLPKFIIGYSSGLNEILSLPFLKMRFIHFDEYNESIKNRTGYNKQPEGRLIFIDSDFSQAILLSNLLLQEESVLKPFSDEIDIDGIKTFRIIIRTHIKRYLEDYEKFENYNEVEKSLLEEKEGLKGKPYNVLNICKQLNNIIENLKKCSTCHFEDYYTESHYFDYKVDNATKEAFKLYFGTPLELFRSFQILLTLNLYATSNSSKKCLYESSSLYFNENIPVLSSEDRILNFKDFALDKSRISDPTYNKSLSDGEYQFIHSIGIALLFKNENCLILFDEPETHFNPDWRANYISALNSCLKNSINAVYKPEVIITTHSPFIISDTEKDKVIIFKKNGQGIVECTRPEFQTFGASSNKITMNVFEKYNTIGGFAQATLEKFYDRLNSGEDPDKLIDEVSKNFGESVEKTVFVNKALDVKEEIAT